MYEKLAAGNAPAVKFVGRLATYKYYNMDQVVAQALGTYKKISSSNINGNFGIKRPQFTH